MGTGNSQQPKPRLTSDIFNWIILPCIVDQRLSEENYFFIIQSVYFFSPSYSTITMMLSENHFADRKRAVVMRRTNLI